MSDQPPYGGFYHKPVPSSDVHVHIHWPEFVAVIRDLVTALTTSNQQETTLAQIDDDLQALTAAVAAEQSTVDSAVQALNGIQQMIADAVASAIAAGATPAQMQAVNDAANAIAAQTASLATAIAAVPGSTPPPAPTP